MRYVALGDSISIDEYPQRETGRWGLGAVSLFHGDLAARFGTVEKLDLTADGATTHGVLSSQLPLVQPSNDESIVTITAGGNDMLMNLRAPRVEPRFAERIVERISEIVATTLRKLPNARVLLGTVYDPSDGTNVLYGERLDREAQWLASVNDGIRSIAASDERIRLIDIHRHFLGHGVTAPEEERWSWSGLIFEPNARGAAEVRRLWLEAINRQS